MHSENGLHSVHPLLACSRVGNILVHCFIGGWSVVEFVKTPPDLAIFEAPFLEGFRGFPLVDPLWTTAFIAPDLKGLRFLLRNACVAEEMANLAGQSMID